jgi:tRNA G18 (ribose-2'-O)-methylase SpoU
MALIPLDTTDAEWVHDPRLAVFRAVRDPELVRRSARFLAEGRLVVRTLLTASAFEVDALLVEEPALAWFEREGLAVPEDVPVYALPSGAMRQLTGFRFHQGCLASGIRPEPVPPAALLAGLPPGPRYLVGLDGVSNPDNVGAIFRSAAALGAAAILLGPDCASPLYRKAIRSSMGAALCLPFCHAVSWDACLDALAESGYQSVALCLQPEARSLEDIVAATADARVALLLGSEGEGLSPRSIERADRRVRIDMQGGVDSLNVAAAAAVALYALRAARRSPRSG